MKKIVQAHFSKGKWEKMLSLARLALAALVCSVGALEAAPVTQEQTQSVRRIVSGTVTNQNGRPIEGVSVSVQGASTTGTVTDARGEYTINTARGATLEFSHVGMTLRTAKVDDRRRINVTMEDQSLVAEEVIVTAGVVRPKEGFVGNARQVTGDQLRETGAGNVANALRNLDPTFYIAENNLMGSNPNAMPIVTMRGETSLPLMNTSTVDGVTAGNIQQAIEDAQKANLPLVLIDGFESEFSKLVDMDENLVENMTLLKDAAATAMYGTRATNGVILVTLKKPKPGTLRLSYTAGVTMNTPDLSSYDLMNAREKLEYERRARLYNPESMGWLGYLSLQRLYTIRKIDVDRGVDTDWMHYPLEVAVGHNHTLQVEGGEESFRYMMTLSYRNNPGVMKGSARNTFRGAMKFEYSIEKLQFMNELSVEFTNAKDSPYGTDSAFQNYAKAIPYFKPYDDDGNPKEFMSQSTSAWSPEGGAEDKWAKDGLDRNPLWDAIQPQRHTNNIMDVRNNFSVNWKINSDFTFRGQGSVSTSRSRSDNYLSYNMSTFAKMIEEGHSAFAGSYTLGMGQRDAADAMFTLQYNKAINDVHLLNVGVTADIAQSTSESYTFRGYGISNPKSDFYGSATEFDNYDGNGKPTGSDGLERRASLAGSVTYIYDNRYTAVVDARLSGSSRFGKHNRYAPNWTVGVGWNIHNEEFITADWINDARITANYGSTLSTNFTPNMTDIVFGVSDRLYGEWGANLMKGVGNADLKWETTYTWDLGADFSMFKRRLNVRFNVYNKLTHDLIAMIPLPSSSGYASYYDNLGKSRNRGWELISSGTILRDTDRNYSLTLGFNIAHLKDVLLEINDGLEALNELSQKAMSEEGGTAPARLYIEKTSRNTMYVKKSLGIDPMSGHEVFLTEDGRQTYEWKDAALVSAGRDKGDYWGTFSIQGQWKGFRVNLYMNYEFGGQVYNELLAQKVEGESYYRNMDRRAFEGRWYEVGQRAKYKSVMDASLTKATTRFVSDNNFLYFSSAQISYEPPVKWCRRVLGAEYLKLSTNFSDIFHMATVKRERGLNYPFARTFNLTASLRF